MHPIAALRVIFSFPKRCALRERPAAPSAIIPLRADSRSGTIGWSGRPSGPRLSRALSVKTINTVPEWCAMEKEIDQNKG